MFPDRLLERAMAVRAMTQINRRTYRRRRSSPLVRHRPVAGAITKLCLRPGLHAARALGRLIAHRLPGTQWDDGLRRQPSIP